MDLQKIENGISGAEAAEIINGNDQKILEVTLTQVAALSNLNNEYLPIQITPNTLKLPRIRVLNVERRKSSVYFFADSAGIILDLTNAQFKTVKAKPNYVNSSLIFELIDAPFWEVTTEGDEFILMYQDTGFWFSIYPEVVVAIEKARNFELYRLFRFIENLKPLNITKTSITLPELRLITMNRFYEMGAPITLEVDDSKNMYITATLGTPNSGNSLTLDIHEGYLKGEDLLGNISTYGLNTILIGYKSANQPWHFIAPAIQSEVDKYYLINGYDVTYTLGAAVNGGGGFAGTNGIACNTETEAPSTGIITKLEFFVSSAGAVKFGVGIVDQWSKAIIERTIELTAVNGFNSIAVNEPIKKGQILFMYVNSRTTNNFGGGASPRMLYNDRDPNGVLELLPVNGTLSLKYYLETKTPNIISAVESSEAVGAQVGALNSKIDFNANNIYSTDVTTGIRYKIIVDNGNLTAREVKLRKVTAFGNSITRHEITYFWWGDWGMAATERSKDWVHQLQTRLRTKDPLAEVTAFNIADWEVNLSAYNYSLLDPYLGQDVDAVILRLGENGPTGGYASEFNVLIDYIKQKAPFAQIIIGGQFWQNDTKEIAMQSSANTYGLPFVSFSYMWGLALYRQTVNTQVYGDDGQWHTISDGGAIAQGVADHPNDLAFSQMAEAFATSLGI